MKKLVTAIMLIALILSGCGNRESEYDQAMKQGRDAIASENLDQAADSFHKALKIKKEDEKALELLSHTQAVQTARRLMDQKAYDEAVKAADVVINQSNVSDKLRENARTIKKEAAAKQKQQASEQTKVPALASEGTSKSGESASSDASDASQTIAESADQSTESDGESSASAEIGAESTPSQSSGAEDSSSVSVTKNDAQRQAESAVVKAAGLTMQDVYVYTVDNGSYYSIEMRENHKADSAADPNTAPSVGFYRYYKDTGRITKLDIPSNTYKEVK
ncbi:hypothetical protein EWH99_09535 [Sporolactobacillus sp. THM7-7]|nr:hypothetical protein EWH99_09535 [Sporolactobacillus sp. THM7-7]